MSLIKSISGIRGTIGGNPGEALTPVDIVKFVSAYCVRLKKLYPGRKCRVVVGRDEKDFHAVKPNRKWMTDVTEFFIPAGKVYLSPTIDCYDGMPVA